MDSTTNRPSPGQPNIVSTIIFPPSKEPVSKAATVTVGMSAFFKACQQIILKRLSPFDSAKTI